MVSVPVLLQSACKHLFSPFYANEIECNSQVGVSMLDDLSNRTQHLIFRTFSLGPVMKGFWWAQDFLM